MSEAENFGEARTPASVSFRQLRLFEAVGRLGAISRAAGECGLSQPAATQSLAMLARKAGLVLLESNARGVALTPIGRELHARVRLLLDRLDQGLRHLGVEDRQHVIWRVSHAQLRLLDATRQRGSLEHAAAVTGMTARAAKQAGSALERLVGQPLFGREDGNLVLTGAGGELARHIGLLSQEVDWFLGELREDAGRSERTVVLGVAPDPGTAAMNAVVKAHVARRPDWRLELVEASRPDLLARLAIGELDLVVGHILDDPGTDRIRWEEIATDTFRIVARHNHPLAGRRSLDLPDLLRETWLLGARGSQRRAASDALFDGQSSPVCALVTSAAPLMTQLLREADHLALMTQGELATRADVLTAIAYDAPPILAHIGLARRADWRPSPVHLEIIDQIKECFAVSPALSATNSAVLVNDEAA